MKQGDIVRLKESRDWYSSDDGTRESFSIGTSFLLVQVIEQYGDSTGATVRCLRNGKNYYGVGVLYESFEPLPGPTS